MSGCDKVKANELSPHIFLFHATYSLQATFVISVSSMKILSFNHIVPGGEDILFASLRTASYFGEQENKVTIKLKMKSILFILWSIRVKFKNYKFSINISICKYKRQIILF